MGLQLQMSWKPNLLKRKKGVPLGLRNLGNTCYLNSVLQCLTFTPPLANFCLNLHHSSNCDSILNGELKRDCPFCIIEKRIVRSLSVEFNFDAPSKILNCLKIFAEHFKFGQQEDAHEFLRYVIDACHNTCLRLKKLRRKGNEPYNGNTVVKEIFGGALQNQLKCLSCGTESNKVDEIMDISLDISHSSSLKDSMQRFFQPEILDGNNKYNCENCKKLVAARKQMSIRQAPNILVIQLKRFEGIYGGKIDKTIALEEVMVLSSFMCKASQDPRPEYKLFGTIVHSGFSPESGHYYAYIKDAMGRWYCCNDSCVSLTTLQEVLSEKAYILFFSRTNQSSVTATASTMCGSNGAKLQNGKGNDFSKGHQAAGPLKEANLTTDVEGSFRQNSSNSFKVEKVPSNPRLKNTLSDSTGTKGVPSGNGKGAAQKSQNLVTKGVMKDSINMEKSEIGLPPLASKSSTRKVDSVNNSQITKENGKAPNNGKGIDENGKALSNGKGAYINGKSTNNGKGAFENGNGKSINNGKGGDANCIASSNGNTATELNAGKDNGASTSVNNGRGLDTSSSVKTGLDHHILANGSFSSQSGRSGSKRKPKEDACILLGQDSQSRHKIEELKESLKTDASLALHSCGWYDKVYSYMRSRKRLRAEEIENNQSGSELKKMLIADAKSTFIAQLPETLKADLIIRLQSFSQEKD